MIAQTKTTVVFGGGYFSIVSPESALTSCRSSVNQAKAGLGTDMWCATVVNGPCELRKVDSPQECYDSQLSYIVANDPQEAYDQCVENTETGEGMGPWCANYNPSTEGCEVTTMSLSEGRESCEIGQDPGYFSMVSAKEARSLCNSDNGIGNSVAGPSNQTDDRTYCAFYTVPEGAVKLTSCVTQECTCEVYNRAACDDQDLASGYGIEAKSYREAYDLCQGNLDELKGESSGAPKATVTINTQAVPSSESQQNQQLNKNFLETVSEYFSNLVQSFMGN